MRIFWDSCIVIYDVERVEPFATQVRSARGAVADARIHVSDLVRLECLVLPLRLRHRELIRAYEARFATLERLDLDSSSYDLAAELRAEHRLKTPDALHVACALRHGCDELWTNDGRLAALATRIPIRVIR